MSPGMLRRVALVRPYVSEVLSARFLVTANVVPSSPILVTIIKEALGSTRRNIPEDTILEITLFISGNPLKYC
jgi:hypothetical protein